MARYDVKPGSTVSGKTLGNGDSMYISSTGLAIDTIINANYGSYDTTSMYINEGGKASGTIIRHGRLYISNGGVAESTTQFAGTQTVLEGGLINSTIISGGTLDLAAGASATNVQINSFMTADYTADSYITGTSNGKDIKVGDKEMNNLTIWYGRYMTVSEGWVASNTTINANYLSTDAASMFIKDGGKATGTVISHGILYVSNGGYVENTTQVNGSQIIYAGGHTDGAVVKGGSLCLSAGASATNVQISNNGFMTADYTADSYITGTSDGKSIKLADGEMNNLTIWYGRYMNVSEGWVASNTTINANYLSTDAASMFINKGGQASGTVISHGILHVKSGGYAENTSQAAGSQIIYNGATASGGSVKGGTMYVANGGTVKGTELRTEGTIILSAGAKAYDLVLSNSNLGMSAGAQLIRTSVCRGGKLAVSNSNVASDTQVLAGGTATIFNKAAASGGNVMSGGTLIFSSGAILTGTINAAGTITVKNGATVSNGTLNFNLVDLKAGNCTVAPSLRTVRETVCANHSPLEQTIYRLHHQKCRNGLRKSSALK